MSEPPNHPLAPFPAHLLAALPSTMRFMMNLSLCPRSSSNSVVVVEVLCANYFLSALHITRTTPSHEMSTFPSNYDLSEAWHASNRRNPHGHMRSHCTDPIERAWHGLPLPVRRIEVLSAESADNCFQQKQMLPDATDTCPFAASALLQELGIGVPLVSLSATFFTFLSYISGKQSVFLHH